MPVVDVKIMAKDDPAPWPDLAEKLDTKHTGLVERVAIMEGGMASGQTSLFIFGTTKDGTVVGLEISANMYDTIAGALRGARARFADA